MQDLPVLPSDHHLPHASSQSRDLDLSHPTPVSLSRGHPSLSSHDHAATTNTCWAELIDITADDDIEDTTLLDMATLHDKYQAEIEVAIYDKMRIELNGRQVISGDCSGNKHGVDALKAMLQELLKHPPAILNMTELISMMGGLKGEMYNHLLTVFPQKLAMSKIKKPDMTEHFIEIWKVFWLVWFHPEIIEQRDLTVASDLDGYVTMMNAAYSRCKIAVHSERDIRQWVSIDVLVGTILTDPFSQLQPSSGLDFEMFTRTANHFA